MLYHLDFFLFLSDYVGDKKKRVALTSSAELKMPTTTSVPIKVYWCEGEKLGI